ncbi:hypothetical protein, conserved [Eimeria praecox]|uniref:Uncharacterized protein n=1 Tax=Eimeria praecox TaxID=51316 RepID=U6GX58_9EIME|nr:hypothetical protein, conserved [Eimeria praecox]
MAQRLLFAAVFGALGAVAEAGSPAGASILSAMEVNEMSVGNAALQRDDVGVRAVASRRAMKPIMLVSIMAVSLAAIYLILQCMRVISGGNGNGASLRRLAGKESEEDDACTVSAKYIYWGVKESSVSGSSVRLGCGDHQLTRIVVWGLGS